MSIDVCAPMRKLVVVLLIKLPVAHTFCSELRWKLAFLIQIIHEILLRMTLYMWFERSDTTRLPPRHYKCNNTVEVLQLRWPQYLNTAKPLYTVLTHYLI